MGAAPDAHFIMRFSLIVAAVLALAAFAGCVERNVDESRPGTGAACATRFVSIHYEGANDTERLRSAFEDAGWTWQAEATQEPGVEFPGSADPAAQQGVARLEPPGVSNVQGVVSVEPGTSADADVILSFEPTGTSSSPDAVEGVANEAGRIVNATFEDARAQQWIVGTHTAACDPLGGATGDIR